jgi:diguanylate cyclase (GGDEF)-like protein
MTERVVLVAEDSLVVRALLRSHLRDQGYTVVEAADGEQALSRTRETQPDVILLDIEMPRLDGFAVLAELKDDEDLCDIPVVFISGRTTADDAVRGLSLGAHDYLRKPFEAAELAARVHAAMRTKTLQDQLRAANEELTRQAHTDALTGLPNRRHLDEELARLCSRSARHDRPLSLLMIDADHFKPINDEYGHSVGDRALVVCARRLSRRKRREDVLGRWGGEEFLLLAPDIDGDGALALAEAQRRTIADKVLGIDGLDIAMTISIGVAAWRGDTPEDLLRRADAALYLAKERGRNRVESG